LCSATRVIKFVRRQRGRRPGRYPDTAERDLVVGANARYLPQQDEMVAPQTPDEMVLQSRKRKDKITATLIGLERDDIVRTRATEVNSNTLAAANLFPFGCQRQLARGGWRVLD
jgi:hypothetical protein